MLHLDNSSMTALSSIIVAFLAGFWAWIQAREHRRGTEIGEATKAAFDLNSRLESNLRTADDRAARFLEQANALQDQLNALKQTSEANEKSLTDLRAELKQLRESFRLADTRLAVAMQHIYDLRSDIKTVYTSISLRPLPDALREIESNIGE